METSRIAEDCISKYETLPQIDNKKNEVRCFDTWLERNGLRKTPVA